MVRFCFLVCLCVSATAFGQTSIITTTPTAAGFAVVPAIFDPGDGDLIPSGWIEGIGCPTKQLIAIYPSTKRNGAYMEPGCPTGDPRDTENTGLLLVKGGPTNDNASSGANIVGVQGVVLKELGYDFRRGLHCGAGSPRFDIDTADGKSYFLGCNSPVATSTTPAATTPYPASATSGFVRLRWGGTSPLQAYNASTGNLETVASQVKHLSIVFDEGQDTGPDFTGMAILDNIDVNGVLVGLGSLGFIF